MARSPLKMVLRNAKQTPQKEATGLNRNQPEEPGKHFAKQLTPFQDSPLFGARFDRAREIGMEEKVKQHDHGLAQDGSFSGVLRLLHLG